MKLKIKEFNELAKKKGYHSGKKLLQELGAGKYAYSKLKSGCMIGYDLVKEIYNAFGPLVMLQVIDLEGETLQSFKSKYAYLFSNFRDRARHGHIKGRRCGNDKHHSARRFLQNAFRRSERHQRSARRTRYGYGNGGRRRSLRHSVACGICLDEWYYSALLSR